MIEVEVNKLYLLWDGELHECIAIRGLNPVQYTFRRETQVKSPGTHDDISTVYGDNVLMSMIEREATDDDIQRCVDRGIDTINNLYKRIQEHDWILQKLMVRRVSDD